MELLWIFPGLLLLFMVPGFILSFMFYLPGEIIGDPDTSDQTLERLILSLVLSLVVVPVATFLLNFLTILGGNVESLYLVMAVSILGSFFLAGFRFLLHHLNHILIQKE